MRVLRQLTLEEEAGGGGRGSSTLVQQVTSLNASVLIEEIAVIFSRVEERFLSVHIFCRCHGIQRQMGRAHSYLHNEL